MDINELNNVDKNSLSKTNESSNGPKPAEAFSSKPASSPADKVSLSDYQFRKDDQLFAKLELEKLNDSASDQLQVIKNQVSEFKNAAEAADQKTETTEIGKKINDPAVWEDIAYKILS